MVDLRQPTERAQRHVQGRAPHPPEGRPPQSCRRHARQVAAVRPFGHRGRGANARAPEATRHGREDALKQACGDLLPRAILERPKSGMRVPVEAWLEGRFERFARERILDGLASHGLFRNAYLEELIRPRGAAVPRRGAKIWLLLSLEAWLRTVVAR